MEKSALSLRVNTFQGLGTRQERQGKISRNGEKNNLQSRTVSESFVLDNIGNTDDKVQAQVVLMSQVLENFIVEESGRKPKVRKNF